MTITPVRKTVKKHSIEWWKSLPPEKVGKETENILEALFKKWNERADFTWHRLPDAKAARGRISAQPADYEYRCGVNAGYIECKATHHESRLTRDKIRQLPILLKWEMAGDQGLVVVHHYLIGKWRCVRPGDLAPGVTSWDLSEYPTFDTVEDALMSQGYFK